MLTIHLYSSSIHIFPTFWLLFSAIFWVLHTVKNPNLNTIIRECRRNQQTLNNSPFDYVNDSSYNSKIKIDKIGFTNK